MKLAIVIIIYNIDARIFILQIECIKKYCKDTNYVIEIIDNSSDIEKAETIKHHAKVQKVNYRKTNSADKNDSRSHAFAANFSYKTFKDSYDLFFYLDHDCIPIKPFFIEEILGNYIMAGVRSGVQLNYFWPGCLIWNNTIIDKELVNFSPNASKRADTGGELYKVIETYGEEKCLFFDEVGCENPYFTNTPLYYFYMLIYNNTFLHFLNSSNWNPTERNDERLNSLINIVVNETTDL